jgi:short subunit dehydrogenase-like uncharacterized protein
MTTREFDVVVFGATGFTGERIVQYLASGPTLSSRTPLKWAVAGRSRGKLEALVKDRPGVGVVVADTVDQSTLVDMCRRARVVISAVGPYRFHGEQVVSACVAAGTDYVDVTGEPQFMESSALQFDAAAKAKGCVIVHACGFDSIPADMGVLFACRSLQERYPSCVPYAVESYLSIHAKDGLVGHYATWASAVHGNTTVTPL